MATINVLLSAEQENRLDSLVSEEMGASRADVMRRGLDLLIQEKAIQAVLESERELSEGKIIRGDLKALIVD